MNNKYKYYYKTYSIMLALFINITFLTACAGNPKNKIITSKNNGAFDINVVQSSSEDKEIDATQVAEYSKIFYSTDHTVEYRFDISEKLTNQNMPVIEVVPHYLTEEDVKRVAYALFGDIPYFEAEPSLDEINTKSDIQLKINRWSQYANESSLRNLLGDFDGLQDTEELIKQFIDQYTKLYELAPDYSPKKCEWKFKPESYYDVASEKINSRDVENDNEKIASSIRKENVTYYFSASTRNKNDFKLNNISAFLYDGISPDMIDERIFRAWLCRTNEPTTEQICNIKEQAEMMLQKMDLGDWLIDECFVETTYYGDTPEYVICLNAVPVLNGTPAIRSPQIRNLKSTDTYASNYYLTDVSFEFSANGELILFRMFSPIDIKEVINNNVDTLSISELISIAETHLTLTDYYAYGFGATIDEVSEELSCIVAISSLSYNLTRVKVPNSADSYYYVPGISLHGNVEYIGKESGDIYFTSNNLLLITLNGVDGSIVNTSH